MAGARGPTVTLHTPSSAFFRSWAPWTKSPETLTSAASGARRRKVTVRSVAPSQGLYAGGGRSDAAEGWARTGGGDSSARMSSELRSDAQGGALCHLPRVGQHRQLPRVRRSEEHTSDL